MFNMKVIGRILKMPHGAVSVIVMLLNVPNLVEVVDFMFHLAAWHVLCK